MAVHFPLVINKTRKPSLEVAPTTLATFLPDGKFLTGSYLFTVSNSCLFLSTAL